LKILIIIKREIDVIADDLQYTKPRITKLESYVECSINLKMQEIVEFKLFLSFVSFLVQKWCTYFCSG